MILHSSIRPGVDVWYKLNYYEITVNKISCLILFKFFIIIMLFKHERVHSIIHWLNSSLGKWATGRRQERRRVCGEWWRYRLRAANKLAGHRLMYNLFSYHCYWKVGHSDRPSLSRLGPSSLSWSHETVFVSSCPFTEWTRTTNNNNRGIILIYFSKILI